ncbi:MAG: helix-turn-helix domain-containing protein [Candidatus Symbiopectobacterium sp. Dall1.0]|nr:helix-turn-helix domain-containing protein [Candidatus Symbiopectobacterium sp. Dall1.0]
MKIDIHDRIRSKRKELMITQNQIAKMLGISRVSVTKWENGNSKPDGEHLHLLANVLGCSAEWLLYGEKSAHNDDSTLYHLPPVTIRKIPLLSWEQLSKWDGKTPIAEIDDIGTWMESMADTLPSGFMMLVKGDSMANPYGIPSIPDGSKILVDPDYGSIEELNGKIVLIQLAGSAEPTIKKLSIDGPNMYLIPLNPSFKVIEINGDYVIKGRVTKIIQEL